MSLQDDIKKIMEMVTSETQKFVTKANGGVAPTADELMAHAESFEFPELTANGVSSTFFCWKRSSVLAFYMKLEGNGGTSVTSKELSPDQWPMPLKMKLAHSIEVRAPDGKITKIL
jgi:hypothetical protein